MIVRMKTKIGGYRNGDKWPEVGGTIDLPAHEAESLIANGYATAAADSDPEPVVDADEPEIEEWAVDGPEQETADAATAAADSDPEPVADSNGESAPAPAKAGRNKSR